MDCRYWIILTMEGDMKNSVLVAIAIFGLCGCAGAPTAGDAAGQLLSFDTLATEIAVSYEALKTDDGNRPTAAAASGAAN